MSTLDEASMGDATMAAAGLSTIAPPPPGSTGGSIYAYMAPIAASLIAYARTEPVRIIREAMVRPDPSLPPSLTGNVIDECVAYVSGYNPSRTDGAEIASAGRFKVIIDPATIDEPPRVSDLIEISGERYVVIDVKRAPAAGPDIVFWKIICGRGV